MTNGCDGTIAVIDTASGDIVSRISVPTSLAGGGYLVAVQSGMEFTDIIGK